MVVKRGVRETCDGLGDALPGSFNGNVIVFLEVDTGLLLGGVVGDTEELALNAGVRWAGDVLAILPGAIARAACVSAAATTAWLAVCRGLELSGSCAAPAATALGTVTAAGSECLSVGVCPIAVRAGGRTVEATAVSLLACVPYACGEGKLTQVQGRFQLRERDPKHCRRHQGRRRSSWEVGQPLGEGLRRGDRADAGECMQSARR
jgi:hypothetical protein